MKSQSPDYFPGIGFIVCPIPGLNTSIVDKVPCKSSLLELEQSILYIHIIAHLPNNNMDQASTFVPHTHLKP